jgi:hypothetical protein
VWELVCRSCNRLPELCVANTSLRHRTQILKLRLRPLRSSATKALSQSSPIHSPQTRRQALQLHARIQQAHNRRHQIPQCRRETSSKEAPPIVPNRRCEQHRRTRKEHRWRRNGQDATEAVLTWWKPVVSDGEEDGCQAGAEQAV